MSITQTITLLPPAPDPATDDAPTFSSKASAMVLAQKAMVPEMNTYATQANALAAGVDAAAAAADADAATASAAASTAVNAPGSGATSTASLTVGTGSKTLTIQTGKLFGVGQFVTIANGVNVMAGSITAYNSGTGTLTVDVTHTKGSGTFASWTVGLSGAPANQSRVPVTPPFSVTAVAAIDFLTIFSANPSFDDFEIVVEGINTTSSSTALSLRFANAGAVDSASNYYNVVNSTSSTAVNKLGVSGNYATVGVGGNVQLTVFNAQAAAALKNVFGPGAAQSAAGTYQGSTYGGVYIGAACSGFRLLWDDGSNFKAQGTIRVYGISKN